MQALGAAVAAHDIDPYEIVLAAVPNVLALGELPGLGLEIVSVIAYHALEPLVVGLHLLVI